MRIFKKINHIILIIKKLIASKIHFHKYPPIFIIGSPRSGTSLLLQLMSSAYDFSCGWEPFRNWRKTFGVGVDDTYRQEFNLIGRLKLYLRYYEMLNDNQPYLLIKDPRDSVRIKYINSIFHKARFIHIIRDGRDVIASIKKTWNKPGYQTDKEVHWTHTRIPDYRKIVHLPVHMKAAHIWSTSIKFIEDELTKSIMNRYFLIKYEDLVLNPALEINKIFTFLKLSSNEEKIEQISKRVNDGVSQRDGKDFLFDLEKRVISSKIIDDSGSGTMSDTRRIGKWENELTEEELNESSKLINEYLRKYDYI